MAVAVRNQNDLITLKCQISRHEQEWAMQSELWDGRAQLGGKAFTPLQEIGIHLENSETEYRKPEFSLGEAGVKLQLETAAELAHSTDDGKQYTPIWLQLSRNAQALSALPWERLTREITGKSLFRIPNFMIDPFSPTLPINIAICASAPVAKARYEIKEYVDCVLNAINETVDALPREHTKVAVFADETVYQELQYSANPTNFENIQIEIIDVKDADDFGVANRTQGDIDNTGKGVTNPWLRWILQHYKYSFVDAVHFVSPSYFTGETGALAFAPSPRENNDRRWSRFVGAKELANFLDELTCNAVFFSSASSKYWRIGHRLLLNELSWLRAGPIIHFDETEDTPDALREIYKTVFRRNQFSGNEDFTIQCSIHPDILKRASESEILDTIPTMEVEFELDEKPYSKFLKLDPNETSIDSQVQRRKTEIDALFAGKLKPQEATENAASGSYLKILAQKRAQLSQISLKSPQQMQIDSGKMKALDFLNNLPQGGKFKE